MFWKLIVVFSAFFVEAELYEDKRCRCICPAPASVFNDTSKPNRTLYIAYVQPNKCNCDGVILPKVDEEIRENAQMFCPRCDCRFETRNSAIIMIVVIIVVWMLVLLIGYYIFLLVLDRLVAKNSTYPYKLRRTTDEIESLLMEELEVQA